MSDAALQHDKQLMLRKHLQGRGIVDGRVLEAMAKVPRERFLDAASRAEAYADRALAIGCGQTISQPYIVALMTQALALHGSERVLEIGTGSGYQTAILAELARQVVSIERHKELSRQAAALLAELGYDLGDCPNFCEHHAQHGSKNGTVPFAHVKLIVGDGSLGWPADAPYDRILVAAAAASPPRHLIDQLADGGILVIPLGDRDEQMLQAIHKHGDKLHIEALSPCRFVPLVGAEGWPEVGY